MTVGPLIAADDLACFEDLRSACAVDRPVDAPSPHQTAIGRIDDGIDRLLRQVADPDLHPPLKKRRQHPSTSRNKGTDLPRKLLSTVITGSACTLTLPSGRRGAEATGALGVRRLKKLTLVKMGNYNQQFGAFFSLA